MALNVLVIDRSPPLNPHQGNALIARELFRRLGHHRISLVAPATAVEARTAGSLQDLFAEVTLVPRDHPVPSLVGAVEADVMSLPRVAGLDLRAARALRAAVHHVAAARRYDVVHVRQLPMARFGRAIPGGRILELIDSETLGTERMLPRTLRTRVRARVAAVAETRAMRGYDIVTAVGEADAGRLRALDPRRRVEVVPNGVDAERFRPGSGASERDLIVFVGAMSFPPNVAAMLWFCREILPRIRSHRPEVRLEIVGRDPAPQVRSLGRGDRILVTGSVEDVRPYLARASVFVAPLVSGSGIKNKVLEAFAAGCAVVSTPLGVEGLPVEDGRHLRLATGPDDFAQAVADLLADRPAADRLGREARALVERRYTWDACAAAYDEMYRELARRGKE